jgi:hypothetical protein
MLERFKAEPVFETPKWNALAEVGRITVYFDVVDGIMREPRCLYPDTCDLIPKAEGVRADEAKYSLFSGFE